METNKNQLIEMAMGYFRSRTLVTAARLALADALHPYPKTIAQLAAECHAHTEALGRLLRALASFGIVTEIAITGRNLHSASRPAKPPTPS